MPRPWSSSPHSGTLRGPEATSTTSPDPPAPLLVVRDTYFGMAFGDSLDEVLKPGDPDQRTSGDAAGTRK